MSRLKKHQTNYITGLVSNISNKVWPSPAGNTTTIAFFSKAQMAQTQPQLQTSALMQQVHVQDHPPPGANSEAQTPGVNSLNLTFTCHRICLCVT